MILLSFGLCKLDLEARQLVVGDHPIGLQPLVFDVLAHLAQNPRRLVTKDELLQAVWRSQHVSDSAVARAVMKARRAIQDSATNPRWLQTLHGRGYRLDVDVVRAAAPRKISSWVTEPSAMRGALGLLPWWNRTGESSLDWTSLGLASLVHHLVEQAKGPKLAPMAASTALWRMHGSASDVLQATCAALGVREAVACELKRQDHGFVLTSWRGETMRSATQVTDVAGDFVQLATRLAERVTGRHLSPDALPVDPFWREQLAQAIGLHEAGNSRQALELLNLCKPHLQTSAHLRLLEARLLYRGAESDATVRVAQQALDLALREGAWVVNARSRITMAYALRDLGRLEEALGQCEAALQVTDQSPDALVVRPRVLDCLTLIAMELGRLQLAVQSADEAATLSRALGQPDDEANALVNAAFVFGQADCIDRATDAVERAMTLGQRSGNLIVQANVLRAQAIVLQWRKRPADALDACRRSLALWTRAGHQVGRDWAMAHILELMSELGQRGSFESEHRAFTEQPGLNAAMRNSARCSHAVWSWKQGQHQAALSAMAVLAAELEPAALQMRNFVGDELVCMLADMGQTDRARLEISRLPKPDRPIRRARSRAAVEHADGHTGAAIQVLRDTWESPDGHSLGAVDLLADLAWLLLEQWSPGDRVDELESLHAHALDHPVDDLPLAVFCAGWRLRLQPCADAAAQWDAVMQRARGRLRAGGWITEPAYRAQLASGRPRPLPGLLTRVFI